jgi:hypothetical protein
MLFIFKAPSSNRLLKSRFLQSALFHEPLQISLSSTRAVFIGSSFQRCLFFKEASSTRLPQNASFSKTSSSPARVLIVSSSTFLFSSLLHCSVQSKNTGFLQTRLSSNAPSQLLEEAKPFLLSSRAKVFQSTKSSRPCNFLFVQHQHRNC